MIHPFFDHVVQPASTPVRVGLREVDRAESPVATVNEGRLLIIDSIQLSGSRKVQGCCPQLEREGVFWGFGYLIGIAAALGVTL